MTGDELEAQNVKYHTPRVAALSSGRFAVYGPFTNSAGLPISRICTLDEVHGVISEATRFEVQITTHTAKPKTGAPVEDLLKGLV